MDLKMEVYTPTLELVGLLEIYRSVIWEEKAFSAGSFSVDSLITASSKALLVPDNIIWIEGATAGIIEYFHEEAGPSGPYITVKGKTLTGILDHNILWGRYDLKGTAPQIMHALVDDCCVHPTRGDTEARKIPGLVLLDPPAGGEAVRSQKTGGSLLTALEELGAAYGVAFGVRFDPGGPQMEFWTRWGQDRSVSQSTNDPVFYSRELDDVLSSEYSYNAQDYRNVALVAGEGEGDDRVMVTVEAQVLDTPEPPAPMKYTVTLTVDPQDGGTATGGGTVEAGENVTVIAAPASGFEFVGWRENGSIVSTSASYTFKPGADRALTAVFAIMVPTYMIEASIDPTGSGTVTGTGRYREGEQATLRARPAEGYKFSGWVEDRPSRLPSGYAELEYIQASGTQYIDTGISSFSDMVIEASIEHTQSSVTTAQYPFGTSSHPNYLAVAMYSNGDIVVRCGGFYHPIQKIAPARRISYKVSNDGRDWVVDGTTYNADGTVTVEGIGRMCILGLSGEYFCKAKLYSFTMKRESTGEYVREFVPCIAPDGNVGLYDLAENKFYRNSGTGTFVAGPEVGSGKMISEEAVYSFVVNSDRVLTAVFKEDKVSRLPDGYTEREYIESDQSFGIDTGCRINFSRTRIVLDIKAKHVVNNSESVVGANYCFVSSFTRYFYLYRYSSTLMNKGHNKEKSTVSVDITNKQLSIDWDFPNSRLSIGADFSAVIEKEDITMSTDLFLGASAETSKSIKASWYSAKIYEDDILLRDFVPCTDSTGQAGFYDLVSGQFFGNSWGGSIAPGPAI